MTMLQSFQPVFLTSLPLLHSILSYVSATPLPQEPPPGPLLIDIFDDQNRNALGQYHGWSGVGDITDGENTLTVATNDIDDYFDTNLGDTCTDLSPYSQHYLHIVYSGSPEFTISLQQHNSLCDEKARPYPETWDSVEAARYSSTFPYSSNNDNNKDDIWIPLTHFSINFTRTIGIALESFHSPNQPKHFHKIELVPPFSVPNPVRTRIPEKLPTGNLAFECMIPNTLAFGIDDGVPELAQEVLKVLREEDVKVTFFVVGEGLAHEKGTNLSSVYREALGEGHEIGLHSWSHPKMEALPTDEEIDAEYQKSIDVVQKKLDVSPTLFRPPFGTLGARTRQSLLRHLPSATTVMWTIDVEDWIWGEGVSPIPESENEEPAQLSENKATPNPDSKSLTKTMPNHNNKAFAESEGAPAAVLAQEKQFNAFKRGLDQGGSLVVLHYLYPSTVKALREMVRYAREKGMRVTTVGECLR